QGTPLVPLPAGWKPGNRLFRNNLRETGKLSFTDVTESSGLGLADKGTGVAASGWSTSAAWIDYDKDGLLDLVVVHYLDFYRRPCYTPQGSPNYCGPQPFK